MHATIVIPMKNTERWIGYALSSVLSQDCRNIDVIVVDDGSTDASRERALRMGDSRVRIVDNVGTGIAAAWNLGASLACGELLMRCDSDDVLPPTRVSSHASWLRRHPEVGALAGACTMIDEQGRGIVRLPSEKKAETSVRSELCNGDIDFHHQAITVRTHVARELGPARPFFRIGEDTDFLLRLGERCDVWYEPTECYQARLRGTSITHSVSEQELGWWAPVVLELQLQRRTCGSDDLDRGIEPKMPDFLCGKSISPSKQAQDLLIGASWKQLLTGDLRAALATGARAALHRPVSYRAMINLGKLAAKAVLTGPKAERRAH
jgi:glycosyl transferase family 2